MRDNGVWKVDFDDTSKIIAVFLPNKDLPAHMVIKMAVAPFNKTEDEEFHGEAHKLFALS